MATVPPMPRAMVDAWCLELGIADHGKRAGGEQAAQIAICLFADAAEQAEKSRPALHTLPMKDSEAPLDVSTWHDVSSSQQVCLEFSVLSLCKAACDIGDKIIRVLDADRYPDQGRRNPDGAPRFLRQPGMHRGRRVANQ